MERGKDNGTFWRRWHIRLCSLAQTPRTLEVCNAHEVPSNSLNFYNEWTINYFFQLIVVTKKKSIFFSSDRQACWHILFSYFWLWSAKHTKYKSLPLFASLNSNNPWRTVLTFITKFAHHFRLILLFFSFVHDRESCKKKRTFSFFFFVNLLSAK